MRGWLATVPAFEVNVTLRDDHGSFGVMQQGLLKIENLVMDSVSYLNPASGCHSPDFTTLTAT